MSTVDEEMSTVDEEMSTVDEEMSTVNEGWVVGENGVLRPKRLNPNVYQPPSLKAVQQMAEAHMQKLGVYPHMEEDGEDEERVLRCTTDSQTETSSRDETSKALSSDRTEEEEEDELELTEGRYHISR
ncbi:hypothetical protein QTP86_013235 [Hemibagrus guttatus]|nr:hypothetical protein QTP86_013235 [Hemibagrus guttatus]